MIEKDLPDLARQATTGITQQHIASTIGVSQAAVSKALRGESRYLSVCKQIIEAFTPYSLVGPCYQIIQRQPS